MDIRKLLIEQHLPALEMKTLCLVSKDWKVLIDTTVTALTPRDFTECQVTGQMPVAPGVSTRRHTGSCLCWAWLFLA